MDFETVGSIALVLPPRVSWSWMSPRDSILAVFAEECRLSLPGLSTIGQREGSEFVTLSFRYGRLCFLNN